MKKAKKVKQKTGEKNILGMDKKEKVLACPKCKSTDFEIIRRNVLVNVLSPFQNNHAQGVCRKCGKKFKIN